MSLTLGEKLRQAREARGITISEVAEQTRISALYLESIENNDYRGLPGGIFNKGFVKSYAKYVGIDEQEALRDYAQLLSDQGEDKIDETKTYRPEVLTDDRSSGSLLPTLIFAAIILGLLTWGVISLVNYLNTPKDPVAANSNNNANRSGNSNTNSNTGNSNTGIGSSQPMPASSEIKVEFKPLAEKINVTATVDGRTAAADVLPTAPATYTGKQSIKISYYKGFTPEKIQLTINGKVITAPAAPANPKRNSIEFEITRDNIQQIWQSGEITSAVTNANAANTAPR
jgi:cytoskeleton protein RodZ